MNTRTMEVLCEQCCKELDNIADNGGINSGNFETVRGLASTLKDLYKIKMLEGSERSQGQGQSQGGSYSNGNSYSMSGQHYVRGHYSRDGGGYSQGNYSNDAGSYSNRYSRSGLMEHLESMMNEAQSDQEKAAIKRCMEELR